MKAIGNSHAKTVFLHLVIYRHLKGLSVCIHLEIISEKRYDEVLLIMEKHFLIDEPLSDVDWSQSTLLFTCAQLWWFQMKLTMLWEYLLTLFEGRMS